MIGAVTDVLVDVVHTSTPDLGDWVIINSLSSADAAPGTGKCGLALLSVAPHPHLLNRPLVEGPAGLVRAPLSLQLQYMFAYFGPHTEAQLRVARIVQAFHTTPILRAADLTPPLADEVESLTVRLLSPTHDERNQIWSALGRPGRLAVFYEVDVAPIDVLQREGAGRVQSHRVEYVGAP